MKNLVTILFFLITTVACMNENNKPPATALVQPLADSLIKDSTRFTDIFFAAPDMNFGEIKMGEKIDVKFPFKNTGNKPLYIISVNPSCGCTVADYTKGAILPGKEGVIIAAFDSNKSHPGQVSKGITVTANTKQHIYSLSFHGKITGEANANTNTGTVPSPVNPKAN